MIVTYKNPKFSVSENYCITTDQSKKGLSFPHIYSSSKKHEHFYGHNSWLDLILNESRYQCLVAWRWLDCGNEFCSDGSFRSFVWSFSSLCQVQVTQVCWPLNQSQSLSLNQQLVPLALCVWGVGGGAWGEGGMSPWKIKPASPSSLSSGPGWTYSLEATFTVDFNHLTPQL